MAIKMGGGNSEFNYKMLVIALTTLLLMPMLLNLAAVTAERDTVAAEFLDEYRQFTGTIPTSEQIWILTGIYEPYEGGTYGYSEDGWLYGYKVGTNASEQYLPTQYAESGKTAAVELSDDGYYRYTGSSEYGNISAGDIYTAITMDASQKSSLFFTPGGRTEQGDYFYYEYTGYRYALQPYGNYDTKNANGDVVPVVATTTSLSLIWYEIATGSGISGQLVLSGNDSGVAYLDSGSIVAALNQVNNTARFELVFNGVPVNVLIRIDPSYIAEGLTVEQCYDYGYWSLMVTSESVDSSSYLGTDNAFNPVSIFNTAISLFTFSADDFGLTGLGATICSLIYSIIFYAALITFGLDNYPVLILAGILAALQGIFTIF